MKLFQFFSKSLRSIHVYIIRVAKFNSKANSNSHFFIISNKSNVQLSNYHENYNFIIKKL